MERNAAQNFHQVFHRCRIPLRRTPRLLWFLVTAVVGASAFSPSHLKHRGLPFSVSSSSSMDSDGGFTAASEAPSSSVVATRPAVVQSSHVPPQLGAPVCEYHVVTVPSTSSGPPRQDVSVEDVTPVVRDLVMQSKMRHGTVTVVSRHTTTSVTINERESRLARDVAVSLLQLLPPDERSNSPHAQSGVRYQHNDLHMRPESPEEWQRCHDNGWNVDDPAILQAWRDQEPINAHSHLLSMLLGSSEYIPVVDGRLAIGQWQSILLVDLDGPRERTVGVQLLGYQ